MKNLLQIIKVLLIVLAIQLLGLSDIEGGGLAVIVVGPLIIIASLIAGFVLSIFMIKDTWWTRIMYAILVVLVSFMILPRISQFLINLLPNAITDYLLFWVIFIAATIILIRKLKNARV